MIRTCAALGLIAGCSTVESSTVLSSTRLAERCGKGDVVATVHPADWPYVEVEVHEERSCATPVEQTVRVDRELRVTRDMASYVGAGVGATIGGALMVVALKAVPQQSSYNRVDGLLMLPLAGAVAGATLTQGLAREQQVQRLPSEVRVVTELETHPPDELPSTGLLTLEGRPVATVSDGRARMPLELAMSIYQRPVRLDGRRAWWSLRPGVWVPGKLPACERAGRAWQGTDLYRHSAAELADLEADAERCSSDSWAFANRLHRKVVEVCRERFGTTCAAAAK